MYIHLFGGILMYIIHFPTVMTTQKFLVSGMTAILGLSLTFPAFAEETVVESRPMTRLEYRLMKEHKRADSPEDRISERKNRVKNQDGESEKTERVRTRASTSSAVDTACVSAAVDTRDTSMMDAMDTMSASLKSAISTRKSALMAAWSLTDLAERNTAMRTVWSDFKKSTMTARSAMKTEKKSIWSTFKMSAIGCNASGADAAGESSDNAL